jgi:hypothetical protein
MRVHGDGRHATLLQRKREPDDRRATGTSQADAEYRGIALADDGIAHIRVVDPALARLDVPDPNRRQMLGKPVLQLVHENVRIIEQAVHEKDDLAFETLQPWRELFARDLRRVTARIVNDEFLSHQYTPSDTAAL